MRNLEIAIYSKPVVIELEHLAIGGRVANVFHCA
jgi:hypothetical protein